MAQLPESRSPDLRWFLGSLIVLFVLVGVTLPFWTFAHPSPSVGEEAEGAIGTWGYYSTEGGHDPVRRPGNTRDELKFRGSLTRPSDAPGP